MVVSRVIADIESRFGKMTVTRGAKHAFLGSNEPNIQWRRNRHHRHDEAALGGSHCILGFRNSKQDCVDPSTTFLLPVRRCECFLSTLAFMRAWMLIIVRQQSFCTSQPAQGWTFYYLFASCVLGSPCAPRMTSRRRFVVFFLNSTLMVQCGP